MVTELKNIGEATQRALQHVQDHDKEADDWKRRIVALETRMTQEHGTK
jgi:hypothetical protein